MPHKKSLLKTFLIKYHQFSNSSFNIQGKFLIMLVVHSQLLNLSYIFCKNSTSWIYFIVLLVRPSQWIKIEAILIFALVFIPLYFLIMFCPKCPGITQLSFFNNLLKGALLNFILEQITGPFGLIVGIIIVLIQLFETLFVQWTLNLNTKNFQTVKLTLYQILKFVFDICLIVLYKLDCFIWIIQMIAIINSLISILNILTETNPSKQIYIKIIISIHLLTIYLGIVQFIYFDNTFTLVIASLFIKIALSMNFQENQDYGKDQIILASQFLCKNNFNKCLMILLQSQEDSLLRIVKKEMLLEQCIYKFNQCVIENNPRANSLEGVAIKQLKSDSINLSISNDIKKIIQEKIRLLKKWKQINYFDLQKFVKKIQSAKKKIDTCYLRQPFGILQSLTVFFYSEVLNDVVEANELITHVKKSAKSVFSYQKNLSKLFYLTAKYQNSKLITNKLSSNAPYKFQEKQINDFLPFGIQEHHDKLIEQYLKTGKSKFAKCLCLNYMSNEGFIEMIDFAIDIAYTNQVHFICLFLPLTITNQLVIIIDGHYQIKATTKSITEQYPIKNIFKKNYYVNSSIRELVKVKDTCIIENVNYFSHPIFQSRSSFFYENLDVMNYFLNVIVNVRKINGQIVYMILEFYNLRNFSSQRKDIPTNTNLASLSSLPDIACEKDRHDQLLVPWSDMLNPTQVLLTDNPICTTRHEEKHLLNDEVLMIQKTQRSNQSGTFNLIKQYEELNDHRIIEYELTSQISSVEFLRQSKFYRKYDLYNKFNKHMPLLRYHKILMIFFVLCLVVQAFFIILQLSSLNLVGFATDINLLEIKNLFFQPLDLFMMTRWDLWTYNYQLQHGIINQSEYNSESQFAKSNLGEGYNALDSNLNSVLFKTELQDILESKFIDAYQYTDTYKYDIYNMTLRGAIQVLLNFQYILKMNYVYEKTVQADSPQIFYSFKNYPLLRDLMTQLNSDIMIATLARGQQFEQDLLTFFICQQLLLFLQTTILILIRRHIRKKLQLFLHLTQYPENEDIKYEIARYSAMQELIQSDHSYIFNYKLKLFEKEATYQKKQTERNVINQRNFPQKKPIPLIQFFVFLFIFYIFVSLNSVFNYFQFMDYLSKYPQTAVYKKQLSDLGGDIPLMFGQREVLYGRINYMYLDNEYFSQILVYIKESLKNTETFTATNPDYTKMLMSSNFTQFYQKVAVSNLCNYLPDYLINKSQLLCPITMEGNMKRGLKTMLVYIQDLIETDMAINNFTHRDAPTKNQLEGAYMISEVINVINKQFYNDLIRITKELVYELEIFNLLYLFGLIIMMLVILLIIKPIIYEKSQNLLHFIYVIPIQTLFNEEVIERTLRIILNY